MKKKMYYVTAAISVLVLGFFLQYIKYDVDSYRFLRSFMNKYANTIIYLEGKNSNDSFLTKRSKAAKLRKELKGKISRINEAAGVSLNGKPQFFTDLYDGMVDLTVQQAMFDRTVKDELMKDKLVSDVYNNRTALKRNAGFLSGLKNGLIIGTSYPAAVKDKFINLTADGESLPVSVLKAYFVTMGDYLNIGLNCFLFYGIAYKAGYIITWLISAYFTVILVFLPVFLLIPKKKPKTTYGF
ncbi:hypothetical protein [Sebaldella sp. S0638]|uniref:hypothetical protein n=1 Tax=Sebaldella sp. S0638 TaxID=2957809 RepID=UPI00209C8C6E|nr:hypothetical protein [Sebaldella sp. S0638]MCP1224584.1 hypothetical protein [Sebaldella sp. S0638]